MPAIERALRKTEAGRALSQWVRQQREAAPTSAGVLTVLAHENERCVHLRHEPGRCALHEAGGLDALGTACRNYPRLVTRLPDGALEVAFNLNCPTASRLLVADPRPLAMVELDAARFPFPPSREAPGFVSFLPDDMASLVPLDELLSLREAWWHELSTWRTDPMRLVSRLVLLYAMPHLEPEPPEPIGSLPPALSRGMTQLEGWLVFRGLAALPERGAIYDELRWPVSREVAPEIDVAELAKISEPVAEVIHAFLDHQVLVAGLHDSRAFVPWLRTGVRRAVLIARLVDALCHRTPFRVRTLLADLVSATTLIEPLAGA